MNELVDWFEGKTGVTVEMPWRKRTGPKPIPGQVSLDTLNLSEEHEPVLEEA